MGFQFASARALRTSRFRFYPSPAPGRTKPANRTARLKYRASQAARSAPG